MLYSSVGNIRNTPIDAKKHNKLQLRIITLVLAIARLPFSYPWVMEFHTEDDFSERLPAIYLELGVTEAEEETKKQKIDSTLDQCLNTAKIWITQDKSTKFLHKVFLSN